MSYGPRPGETWCRVSLLTTVSRGVRGARRATGGARVVKTGQMERGAVLTSGGQRQWQRGCCRGVMVRVRRRHLIELEVAVCL